jgi:hypothetical protein
VARLDISPGPDTPGPAVEGEGVRALSASDTPPAQPSTPDSSTVGPSAVGTQTGTPEPTPDRPGEQAARPPAPATPHPASGQADTATTADAAPSEVDTPPVHLVDAAAGTDPHPSTPDATTDTPAVQAADAAVDTPAVQPAAVSTPPAGGARDRLAAAYAGGRPDGGAWTARTLAQAAGCGRSTAAAFLHHQRQAQQEPGSDGS